jgi:hypothetical protein
MILTTPRPLSRPLLSSVFFASALAVACGQSVTRNVERLGSGKFRLNCKGALPACLAGADHLCRESSYEVLRAQDDRKRFGGEGSSVVETRSSVATVRCMPKDAKLPEYDDTEPEARPTDSFKLPPRRSDDRVDPALVDEAKPAAVTACVPGATQTCVGSGACKGGQSCRADGKGFSPCDCGAGQAPDPMPAPSVPTVPTP